MNMSMSIGYNTIWIRGYVKSEKTMDTASSRIRQIN